jgi:hypothetical protein
LTRYLALDLNGEEAKYIKSDLLSTVLVSGRPHNALGKHWLPNPTSTDPKETLGLLVISTTYPGGYREHGSLLPTLTSLVVESFGMTP